MSILRIDPWASNLCIAFPVKKEVDGFSLQVTSLDNNISWPHFKNPAGCPLHLLHGPDLESGQDRGFMKVRGHHEGREESIS